MTDDFVGFKETNTLFGCVKVMVFVAGSDLLTALSGVCWVDVDC